MVVLVGLWYCISLFRPMESNPLALTGGFPLGRLVMFHLISTRLINMVAYSFLSSFYTLILHPLPNTYYLQY